MIVNLNEFNIFIEINMQFVFENKREVMFVIFFVNNDCYTFFFLRNDCYMFVIFISYYLKLTFKQYFALDLP